jgi:saccharopine dehydrogenase-like NADP-dependent oxidoreductase
MIDQTEDIHILVGGLPADSIPPLGYVVTWSVGDLLEEYTRKARIVQNGRMLEVEALTGLEEVDFPSVDKLEGFYTDGLRTLLHTVKGVKNMWEKTLRYPGHAEKIQLLNALGFFDEAEIEVGDVLLSPRTLTTELLRKKLQRPDVKDILVMRVKVRGIANGSEKSFVYHLLDRYDADKGITAMARTTAFPASIVGQLMVKKTVEEKGVIPLERLGMKEGIYNRILTELARRQVKIEESLH